jgi:hypothetical protein
MSSEKIEQCPGECADDCAKCGSGDWDLMCDTCRDYAREDAEVAS